MFGGIYQLQDWFNFVGDNKSWRSKPSQCSNYISWLSNSGNLDGSPGFGADIVQRCSVVGGVSKAVGVVGSSSYDCKKRFSSRRASNGVAGSESNLLVHSFLASECFRFPRM